MQFRHRKHEKKATISCRNSDDTYRCPTHTITKYIGARTLGINYISNTIQYYCKPIYCTVMDKLYFCYVIVTSAVFFYLHTVAFKVGTASPRCVRQSENLTSVDFDRYACTLQ